MQINIGELNERIEILRRTQIQDADGYHKVREELVRSTWAKVSSASGTEIIRSGAEFGEEKLRFLVRRTAKALDRHMVVRYQGELWDIQYVHHYGRTFTELWCARAGLEA